jgi:hypothetical protein
LTRFENVADLAIRLRECGVYRSPYAPVFVMRVALEEGGNREREKIEAAVAVMGRHAEALRCLAVGSPQDASQHVENARQRLRLGGELQDGPTGLNALRWDGWKHGLQSRRKELEDQIKDIDIALYNMASAEHQVQEKK